MLRHPIVKVVGGLILGLVVVTVVFLYLPSL